jgi:nucleoside-diphosphate-sugar epimerase
MSSVVLTGSAGTLGRRVATRLVASPVFDRVIGLDLAAGTLTGVDGYVERQVDLLHDDLGPHLEGVATVVHLASSFARELVPVADTDVDLTRRVLDAAAAAGVAHVVLMSSATVYGAWPDNPIPLTEDAPVRPNPGFDFAHDKAEVERLAERARAQHPGLRMAVLRPTTTVGDDASSWVSHALTASAGLRIGDVDPPVQFLHFDDLATATVLVAELGLEGPFNVAPDGWIPPDAMRALAGLPRPRVPVAVARRVAAARWHLGLSPTPPQVLPWAMHPWVIANDRLRAEGWEPAHTNEEAYVVTTAPGPLDTLSPKRRQELALGAVGAAVAVAGVGAAALVARRLRRGARPRAG